MAEKKLYRSIVISKFGGPEVLETVENELRDPENGKIRIKTIATSACFTDTMIRKGVYPDVKKQPPFSPGYDLVGLVDAIGEGVIGFEIGQKVAALTVIGAYSEYVYLNSEECIILSDTINPEDATSLILTYVTAYQMLRRMTNLSDDDVILIHGASGAVGTALIELGLRYKLKIYGTASTKNQDFVKELGATPIDYQTEDFVEKIMAMEPEGVNAIFDPIAGSNFARSFRCLKNGGTLVTYGMYNASIGRQSQMSAYMSFGAILLRGWLTKKNTKTYSIAGLKQEQPTWFKEDLEILCSMLEKKEIKPIISKKFTLMNAKDAHFLLETRNVNGKILLINER